MNFAKVEVFTNHTCPHCPTAWKQVQELAAERKDIKAIELSTTTPKGQKRARALGVMSVPTIFVSGSVEGKIGFRGTPSKKKLSEAIDVSLGLKTITPKKSFFTKLKEAFQEND